MKHEELKKILNVILDTTERITKEARPKDIVELIPVLEKISQAAAAVCELGATGPKVLELTKISLERLEGMIYPKTLD